MTVSAVPRKRTTGTPASGASSASKTLLSLRSTYATAASAPPVLISTPGSVVASAQPAITLSTERTITALHFIRNPHEVRREERGWRFRESTAARSWDWRLAGHLRHG